MRRLVTHLTRWEAGLVALLLVVLVVGQLDSGHLLTVYNLQTIALNESVLACLALGLAPVIIAGDIDISIASALALCGVVMAHLWTGGLNIWLAVAAAIALGAILGLINGFFVAVMELPALAITLGTMGAFTGAAFLIIGGSAITGFPSGLVNLGSGTIPGTQLPIATAVVAGLAVALGYLVHFSSYGKALFAVGGGRQAALFSGVAVTRTRILAFVLAGVFASIAGILYLGNYQTAQATIGNDQLLPAITAVILGGVSAYGGTGTIPGVAIAIVLLAMLQNALGLAGVSGEAQTIAVGILLIVTMGGGAAIRLLGDRPRSRGRRRKPVADVHATPG